MNMHKIELPPLPPLHIVPSVEPVDYPEVAQVLLDYARRAIEVDRKRKKPLTSERIKELWGETLVEMGDGGDPVIWFARAIERAHGIPAPQPAEMEDPNTSPLSGKGPFKTASELIDSINEPVEVPSGDGEGKT